jgi:hypothetical protein
MPGLDGPKARWTIYAQLLQAVQPPDTACAKLVDTDDKKDYFMIDLSTKLQERMTLNTGGSFPEFVSNVIISDDMICAHKDAKKRKAIAAPSGSAPPRYWMVYHHGPTYLPRQ